MELIESVPTNYHELSHKARVSSSSFHTSSSYIAVMFTELLLVSQPTSPRCLSKCLSNAPRDLQRLCLKQFSAKLATEAGVALILLIKLVNGGAGRW